MPRRVPNHINPTLEAPSFHGNAEYSKGAKAIAFKEENERPSPYGNIPLQIQQPEYVLGKRLTTKRRYFEGNEATLPKTQMFNYPRKNAKPGVFPQSIPMRDGRASNFDTYYQPNENPYPVMLDILDAQRSSMVQNEKAYDQVIKERSIPDYEKIPDFIYLQSRTDENINTYFADLSESFQQKRIQQLMARGYSEDEISAYLEKERMRDIEKAIKNPDDPEIMMRAALARQLKTRPVSFTHVTGTNAPGIGFKSEAQSFHTVSLPTKTPAAKRKEARDRSSRVEGLKEFLRTGQESTIQNSNDPRDRLSAALGKYAQPLLLKDKPENSTMKVGREMPGFGESLYERAKKGPITIKAPEGTTMKGFELRQYPKGITLVGPSARPSTYHKKSIAEMIAEREMKEKK